MKITEVAWSHASQNFWIGCNPVSSECVGCYAKEGWEKKGHNFSRLVPTQTWNDAYDLNAAAARQGRCALCFTCSWSDFFHVQADAWRDDAWRVIRECQNLIWMVLTKRPERILANLPSDWEGNFRHVWLGTTCGCQESFQRVDLLRQIPCSLRFLSIEPLLESIANIDLSGIGWLLVGGMSGDLHQKHRMNLDWAASVYHKARREGVPYFFKQASAPINEWGNNALGLYLAEREGREVDPLTVDLVRQYPETPLPLMPLDPGKGHRFTKKEWDQYKGDLSLASCAHPQHFEAGGDSR